MGMDQDVVDYALDYARGKGVEYAEVRAHSQKSDGLVLRNGVLQAYQSTVDSGFCVRVLVGGGIGFASSNRWSREEAKDVVDLVLKYGKAARRKKPIVFAEERGVETKWTVSQKREVEDVSAPERIEVFVDVQRALAGCGVKVDASVSVCSVDLVSKYFVNSEGSCISSFVPRLGAYVFVTVSERGKTEQAGEQFGYSGGWEALKEWKIADRMVEDAKVLRNVILKGKAVEAGKMDLVCGPEVTGIAAHESCGHPMEGDRILGREMSQAGRSFIYEGGPYWIGDRIGSKVVTVVDDPTVEHSYGFYAFDDEGVKAKRRYLYRNGVIHEFLHNRESAAGFGVRSNGSSRAISYDREAIVRMANTFVEPGDVSEEELIGDVKRGVFMKSFTEWNIDDKRFNQRYVGREAYLIEKGELTVPVAKPVIETTTLKFWSAVDAVSKRVEFDAATCGKGDPMQGVPVFTGGPAIRLRGVYVK